MPRFASVFQLSSLLLFCIPGIAQQDQDSSLFRPAQVTFAWPVGSNGVSSMKYTNAFSLNLLYGLNGGVKGLEISSVAGFNRGNMTGIQIAGVSSINTGKMTGLQVGGVLNANLKTCTGIQVAGVVNANAKTTTGWQIAGVANASNELTGQQIAGAINFSAGPVKGVQIAGAGNVAAKAIAGVQIAGAVNLAAGTLQGLQIAPVNVAGHISGHQLGVVNIAGNMKGVQVGVINIAGGDSTVVPIGIISVVKGGYYAFEVTTGETVFLNVAYKMGVKPFYTIYQAGLSRYQSLPVFSYGMGFGGIVPLTAHQSLSIEATSNQIVWDNHWGETINQLNKADLTYRYTFAKGIALVAGPSLNVYVADMDGQTLPIPYTLLQSGVNTVTSLWIGGKAGLLLEL